MDLGCGHGIVSRDLSPEFSKVIGTDPSIGMIKQARSTINSDVHYSNLEYLESNAEDCSFLSNGSVDMVVAGQAAHWFNYPVLFPEMKRVVRHGGTLAFWGYKDPIFLYHPKATDILDRYSYANDENLMGPYWPQPGRSIVQNKLRDIIPPSEDWEHVSRIEYEPNVGGDGPGEGTMFITMKVTLENCINYVRTFSAFHGWQERHPDKKSRDSGGQGDLADQMFDEMREAEPAWQDPEGWKKKEVVLEFGSGLLMARRK